MRLVLTQIFSVLVLLGTVSCQNPTTTSPTTGSLKIRSYSDSYTDVSLITAANPINAILDIVFPDGTTKTVVTDALGFYTLSNVSPGSYTVKPRYYPSSAAKACTVTAGQTASYEVPIPQAGIYFYEINPNKVPVDALLVRQALAKSISRQDIATASGATRTLAFDTFPTQIAGTWSASGHTIGESIPDANAALGSVGTISVEILYNTSTLHQDIANVVKAKWVTLTGSGSSSITVSLASQDWDAFLTTRETDKNFQVARGGWVLDSNNLLGFYKTLGYIGTIAYQNLLTKAQSDLDNSNFSGFEADLVAINDYLLDNSLIIPMYFY